MFDFYNLKNLNKMSDDYLKEKLSDAVSAAGGGKVSFSNGDISKLREIIMNLNENDIRKITESMDPKTVEAIKSNLTENLAE